MPAAPLSLAERRRGRSYDPFVVACGRIRPPAAHLSTSRRPSGISSFETALALLPQLATSLHVHHFLPLSPSRSDGPTSPIFSSIVRGKATSWSRILYSLRPKILVIEIKWGWGNLVCTSDLVQTGRKGDDSSTDWSSNRSLGRKGKYRGNDVHSGMTRLDLLSTHRSRWLE